MRAGLSALIRLGLSLFRRIALRLSLNVKQEILSGSIAMINQRLRGLKRKRKLKRIQMVSKKLR